MLVTEGGEMKALGQLLSAAIVLVSITQRTPAKMASSTLCEHTVPSLQSDLTQMTSVKSSNYLGVKVLATGKAGDVVSADRAFHAEAVHFRGKYSTLTNGWTVLSELLHRAASSIQGKEQLCLISDDADTAQLSKSQLSNLYENVSLVLGSSNVIRDDNHGVIFSGPCYRARHLTDGSQKLRRYRSLICSFSAGTEHCYRRCFLDSEFSFRLWCHRPQKRLITTYVLRLREEERISTVEQLPP